MAIARFADGRWTAGALIRLSLELVVDPAPCRAEHDERQGEADQEEDPGHRSRVTELAVSKCLAIEIEHVEQRGVVRTAFGDDVGLREYLQAESEADDDVVQDERREQRKSDV